MCEELIINKDIGHFFKGDILKTVKYQYNGIEVVKELNHASSMESVMFNWSVGDELTFIVERDGKEAEIVIEISSTTVVI